MIRSFLLVCFIICSVGSNPLERNATDVCQLTGYFVQANGYGWANINPGIACTCPDGNYTIGRPCRICDKIGICGPADALCSEELQISSSKLYFGCFCPSGFFLLGAACPEESVTALPVTTETTRITTAVPAITTSTTQVTDTTTSAPIIMTTTTATAAVITVTTTWPQTTTARETTTTTTQCLPPRSSGSRLWRQTTLMIVLNLVYFVTK